MPDYPSLRSCLGPRRRRCPRLREAEELLHVTAARKRRRVVEGGWTRTDAAPESECWPGRGAKFLKQLAGAGGFEPPHGGTKIRCLTAWLRPIGGLPSTRNGMGLQGCARAKSSP